MTKQRSFALALPVALTAALVFAAGCKTESPPAASPPAKPVDSDKPPAPRPEVAPAPPPPALPADQARGSGSPGDDWRAKRAARLDTDGDGTISDDEREAALHNRAEMMHRRLDADGDGKLTPAELEGARGRMRFDDRGALDTNHDGEISADELAAGMKARNDRRRAARAGGSAGSSAP